MKSNAGRNAAVARQQNRPASPARQNMRTSNAQSSVRRAMVNHRVFARHDGNWHHDWDKHHAHFDHGHVFVFTDGFWWGLYPWDYYPYDAYGSYPSDSNDDPYGNNDYPYNSSTITLRTRIATTPGTLPHLKVATQSSAQSSRSWQNLDTTAVRSTE